MAPVIWGLPLADMRWGAFKSSNMFRRDYHLRRAKMIVYQIAMILCLISESVGTDALTSKSSLTVKSKECLANCSTLEYVDQQSFIENLDTNAQVHNDDFVGIASYNIFVGIFVATIFGAGFFFDLFWPERHESKRVRLAWKICAILACIMALADALALTVRILNSHAIMRRYFAKFHMYLDCRCLAQGSYHWRRWSNGGKTIRSPKWRPTPGLQA